MTRKYLEDAERATDGRNVDAEIGALSGEGSHQRVRDLERPFPVNALVPAPPATAGAADAAPTYYGQPILKEPVWVSSIAAYFYVGGVAGASSVLGVAADLVGGGRMQGLVKRCHWVGAVGDAIGGALLVHDLGRPERFLNMLRVFRIKSPMSMGSWILAVSGAANGAAVLLGGRRGALGQLGRVAGTVGGIFGAPLVGYPAVLLNNTANPLWQHTHRTLPILFMSSAAATSGALLDLLPNSRRERRAVRTFGTAGAAASLAAGWAVEREASRVPLVIRPLKEGVSGALWTTFKVCTAAGLALSLVPKERGPRWVPTAANVLTTVGALAMRFGVFYAGKKSARDPQATFQSQREGLGSAEVGAPSKVLRDARPDRFPLPVIR